MVEFKDRLRLFRAEKELSAAEVAVVFKKSEGAVRMWETGRAKPDADTLIKLAEYFECSTDYLLGLSAYKNSAEHYAHKKIVDEIVGKFEDSLGKLDYTAQAELAYAFTKTINILNDLPSHSDTAVQELIDVTEYIGKIYQHAAEAIVDWDEKKLLMLVSDSYSYRNNLASAMIRMLEEYLAEHIENITDEDRKEYLAQLILSFFPDNVVLKSLLAPGEGA